MTWAPCFSSRRNASSSRARIGPGAPERGLVECVGDQELRFGNEAGRAALGSAAEQRQHTRAMPVGRPAGLVLHDDRRLQIGERGMARIVPGVDDADLHALGAGADLILPADDLATVAALGGAALRAAHRNDARDGSAVELVAIVVVEKVQREALLKLGLEATLGRPGVQPLGQDDLGEARCRARLGRVAQLAQPLVRCRCQIEAKNLLRPVGSFRRGQARGPGFDRRRRVFLGRLFV